jgi:hypothetical protein
MEQLSPLCRAGEWSGGDRIGMDGTRSGVVAVGPACPRVAEPRLASNRWTRTWGTEFAYLGHQPINYALGFIPGYNAAKFVAAQAGISLNPVQNVLAGKSVITVGGPSVLGGLNALGSAYYAVSWQAFVNAGGTSLKALPAAGAITDLGKIASSAGTIANVLNTASAAFDLYQCYQIK